MDPPATARLRIDKWLWAARFYKTRSLATDAVAGGKAQLNGQRVKPAHDVRVGDVLDIHIGELAWTVTVRVLSERRGPAPLARTLYEESEASLLARQAELERRRRMPDPGAALRGRPTKRDRRQIERWRG